MADDLDFDGGGSDENSDIPTTASDLNNIFDGLQSRASGLTSIANAFARAMTSAFSRSASSGRQFDNVLKSLALRISSMAVSQALRPLFTGMTGGGSNNLFGGLFGGGASADSGTIGNFPDISMVAAMGAIKPFAGGGVIGTPTYFPLSPGGIGLAGEAGPEAIMPLSRGPDGRLGVAAGAKSGAGNITIQIMTPDAESFRRSETYVTGQIARAVARGHRSM